jgi:hypothetical protein
MILLALVSALAADADAASFVQSVPGTALTIEMVEIPGKSGGPRLWFGRTEVPWELFDAFVYQLDRKDGTVDPGVDAVARPTKPYISMDRGFGHAGWPTISMSARNAHAFCEWLSRKTGRTYRLPTVEEWTRAAERAAIPRERVAEFAWVAENAGGTTHKIGTRLADGAGLHDLYGNAAEWVVDAQGTPHIIGGSYRDAAGAVGPALRLADDPEWNASDPQFPKSVWWLADGGFIGLRVVTEGPPGSPGSPGSSGAPSSPDTPASPGAPALPNPTPSPGTHPSSPAPQAPSAPPVSPAPPTPPAPPGAPPSSAPPAEIAEPSTTVGRATVG